MVKVVGIKFKSGGKLYYFAPKAGEVYTRDMPVIVETARGLEYAWVAYPEREVTDDQIVQPLKSIVRIATQKDKDFYASCQEKKPRAIQICKEKIAQHELEMKLIDCEYAFDGNSIIFFFTAATRIDFRNLVKDLASTFHTRIELRQVGTRDETKYLGGIAPCGRVCCCAGNMPEFKKVSVKMAKTQGLSLNPGKISGLCGRLMCCLGYEIEHYTETAQKMPKVGSEVTTPDGRAIVVTSNMLTMQVKTKAEDGAGGWIYRDYDVGQLKFKKTAMPAQYKNKPDPDDEEDTLTQEQ